MISSHEVQLSLPTLPPSARTAHLFPALGNTSLISIGQLCDAGCLATFSSSHVDIALHGTTIPSGTRSLATNRLWTVELPQAPVSPFTAPFAGSLQTGTVPDLVAFAHAALFSPSISTLSEALSKNYISNFPAFPKLYSLVILRIWWPLPRAISTKYAAIFAPPSSPSHPPRLPGRALVPN
jgi:hypothetical protein